MEIPWNERLARLQQVPYPLLLNELEAIQQYLVKLYDDEEVKLHRRNWEHLVNSLLKLENILG